MHPTAGREGTSPCPPLDRGVRWVDNPKPIKGVTLGVVGGICDQGAAAPPTTLWGGAARRGTMVCPKSLAEGSCRRRQSPKRPELRERLKNTHVKAQVKLGRCRHAMSTSHHATALPVKGTNPKPKGQCSGDPPLPGSLFSGISSCGTLRFAPWTWKPLRAWSRFTSISSCGAFISLHFGLVGLYFLAFWPSGPSFPFILALWAFISLHFGLLGIYFWPCGLSFSCILALWAFIPLHFGLVGFISLHFDLVGLHFLAFWHCGPSFPCILAFWAFISLHFGLVGLHFLLFWLCGPLFSCILALWTFISLHFGLHFLAFWPFGGQLLGPPPTSCQKLPVCPMSLQWIYQRRDRLHFAIFSLLGLYFFAFWPCGPSCPCILAFWGKLLTPQVAKNGLFAQRPYSGFVSAVTGSIL